jgi:hypothetical protein
MAITLYDPETGSEYSANAGDYWNYEPNHIFKSAEGVNLWLKKNGVVVKKIVRKKDLRDEIYQAQKKQRGILNKRKSVSNKLFTLRTVGGSSYTIDGRGRITQTHNYKNSLSFSGQWLLLGWSPRWNSVEIVPWNVVLKNSGKFKGGYIHDLDNGNQTEWSDKLLDIV